MDNEPDETTPGGDRREVPDRRDPVDRRQQTAPPPDHERRSGSDRREGPRRRRELPTGVGKELRQIRAQLASHSRAEKQAALATTEQILVSLRREPDPDYALRELIQSIENEQ